jgi:hypothetical protein
MLNLRAIWTCDQWNEFDKYWGERENARLYPYLESLSAMEWTLVSEVRPLGHEVRGEGNDREGDERSYGA